MYKAKATYFLKMGKKHLGIIESIHVHVSETDPITSDLKEKGISKSPQLAIVEEKTVMDVI